MGTAGSIAHGGRRGRLRPWILAATLLLAGGLPARGGAQESAPGVRPAPPRIQAIEVEGNRRLSEAQILRWFSVRPGDVYDPRRVARALKALADKQRFADLRVEGELAGDGGIVLHLVVEEFPQLREVRLVGNDKVSTEDLQAVLRLRAQSFLTPWGLRQDRERLLELYRDKGYFQAAIRDSLLEHPDGTRDLVLHVDEGPKASVKRILFVGNDHVPAKDLRKQMETKKDGFLSGGDLKLDVLQKDFESLARYYASLGYLDARVVDHDIELGDNGKDLTLTIRVDEGPQYRVGTVSWQGNTVFDDSTIASRIQLAEGQPFSEAAFEASTTALYELYQDRGYFYFNATPRRDVRDNVVNLVYTFFEGEQARLNHVRIVGNTKTQDKVILREFSLFPGDTFERAKLMRSIRDVFQLGFFEDVSPSVSPRDDARVDVELRVVERQTGQLGAGAGYSAVNSLTGFFEMAETNLFGTGKRMSLRWEFGRRRNDISFSFTQPWLFDTPTTMTLDLFNSSGRSRLNSFYRVRRTGGALRIGRRLDFLDYTTAFWRLRAESVKFTDFDASVPDSVRTSLARDRRRFTTGVTLRRNSTDSPFFPTRGSEAELSTNLSGTFLGGDESYLRNELEVSWYHAVASSRFTFMLKSRLGLLQGLEGRTVPNDELFRLGGVFFNGVRGYDEFEIVPTGNAPFDGGKALSIFVAELRYPFSPRVHGALFFDAGNTWNDIQEADFSALRKGAGVGIRVQVPMLGLLGLDYAYGFDRVDSFGNEIDSWNLHFRFGNLF